jgi:hypothetical protein
MHYIIHIVGINTFIKEDMINKFKENNFEIFDLDDLSKEILFSYNKDDIGVFWKSRLNKSLENFILKNKDKNIIILGLSSFVLDHRYKIKINTEDKFFFNIPYDICASQLINYNLDSYRNDIIYGKFPLKYLNHSFLMSQRKDLQEEYINMGYKLKTPEMLSVWLNDNIKDIKDNKDNNQDNNEDNNQDNKIYLATTKRFEGVIPESYLGSKPIIIGYKDKWMAIASIMPRTAVQRGILQDKGGKNNKTLQPYLKELHINGFAELKKPCYIYELEGGAKLDEYRHEIKNTKFCNRFYISNMYDELIRNNVKLDKFKF